MAPTGLALLVAAAGAAAQEEPPPLAPHADEVERRLAAWAEAAGDRAEAVAIGESAGGRPILALRVALPGDVPPGERPAVFVGANAAGWHGLGTEAALDLLAALLDDGPPEGLGGVTFFVAPLLNPDAHEATLSGARRRVAGNAQPVDRDRDGAAGEDGPDDLDGDGRITRLRLPDPEGAWRADAEDPRVLVRAAREDPPGPRYRLETEGDDQDGDGAFNEDPPAGVAVDRNFAHAWPYPDPAAGPWPSAAPEAKAVMDFLLARPRVVAAVVLGPANTLLALPEAKGGGGKLKPPGWLAGALEVEPGRAYRFEELWAAAKDTDFVRERGLSPERLEQIIVGEPATTLHGADRRVLEDLARGYRLRLRAAGLDADRPAEGLPPGGLTPWLYFHLGVLAFEVDVWGVPSEAGAQPAAAGEDGDADADDDEDADAADDDDEDAEDDADAEDADELTPKAVGALSREDLLALDPTGLDALLRSAEAPADLTADDVLAAVRAERLGPKDVAAILEPPATEAAEDVARRRAVLAYWDRVRPGAVSPWTPVTLADGTPAEAGGLDPLAALAPPAAERERALAATTALVLDLARRLPAVAIADVAVEELGGGLYRLEVRATNTGRLPTHTAHAVRAAARIPLRLEVALPDGGGAAVLGERSWRTAERLEPGEVLAAEWLVRAPPGLEVTVRLTSQAAGGEERTVRLGGDR